MSTDIKEFQGVEFEQSESFSATVCAVVKRVMNWRPDEQAATAAPARVESTAANAVAVEQDPWDHIFGLFNDDPSWQDFPGWLREQYQTSADPDNSQD
jgi:hypothetical protein